MNVLGTTITPETFWEWADRDHKSGCWLWKGGQISGYGSYRRIPAHRVSYALEHGGIPDGHIVHHTCRQRICVKPAHLKALTPTQHTYTHYGPTRPSVKQTPGTLRIWECLRCNHSWPSRQACPKMCPKCKTKYWDMSKEYRAESRP